METVKRCEQITLDYERGQFQTLSVKDRLQIQMHLGICSKCRRYIKDSKKMDLWLKRRFTKTDETVHFSKAEKDTIKERIQ